MLVQSASDVRGRARHSWAGALCKLRCATCCRLQEGVREREGGREGLGHFPPAPRHHLLVFMPCLHLRDGFG